ncbi:DNA-binding transcriptional regulator, GntR family [Paramicrobacterium humi]|uniref:DNA-binding transcriptional regulator, GntR family n=1 Tax=Paramicrobacterium humi TaxID=640635 RepID=A0A1H4LJY1_9MICO|nr:GntR family transcriptional regulator [Microbacterium humi]SEB70632.1 DNA-binding transcriptional regulator, GntR family [Microbacterium humi]
MADTIFSIGASTSLERRGLRDRVYDLVLDMLMSSQIEPGTRLSIDAIARDLSVSPTPVREALVQLERTGLVTREAHKGYRVAPPIADGQLESLFDARLVLETGATALAAREADVLTPVLEHALDEHIAVTKRVRAAHSHGDMPVDLIREYFAVDWNFHHQIFEGTHNAFLIDMSEAISTRVHRMRQTVMTGVSDADEAVAEHRAIIEALADGPEAAAQAMRDHVEKVRERSRRDASR